MDVADDQLNCPTNRILTRRKRRQLPLFIILFTILTIIILSSTDHRPPDPHSLFPSQAHDP